MRYTEAYVSDLEDTLSQLAKVVGCPVQDPDVLIQRTKYMAAAASTAFNAVNEASIRSAFERLRSKDPGSLERAFPRTSEGDYEASLLQNAWESFHATVQDALRLLADACVPEERAVQCMLEMCMALDLHPVPHVEATSPYEMLTAILRELSK